MLLGLLFAFAGAFIIGRHTEAKSIQAQRNALRNDCNILRTGPSGIDNLESSPPYGMMTTRAECTLAFGITFDTPVKVPISKDKPSLSEGATATVGAYQSTDDNFLRKQKAALEQGNYIKNLKVDNVALAFSASLLGLGGFVGGFCIWLFYRLVRFAIKG